ncbi:peptidase [Nemania abortiva]|nr:peptidase [Nemania abortiva]
MQAQSAQITPSFERWRDIFKESFPSLDDYASVYKDLHEYPDLPCQESHTASVVAGHLKSLGYEVKQNIGGHGVVGILSNGEGKTVLLRSELDALPMEEKTGLSYASKVKQVDADGETKPVMHGCGHDMHMASLLGAADLLRNVKDKWSGTVVCVFQPNEERLLGAKAMIEDGLFDMIPLPDIVLGQHAVPTRAGTIGTLSGRVLGFLDSLHVRVYGKGTHSSTPELGINPVLLASRIIGHLPSVVAEEIDFKEHRAITCGYFRGGTDASIIPDFADFTVDVRSFKPEIQKIAVDAVKRVIEGQCQAANSPKSPKITTSVSCPPIDNDEDATAKFTSALLSFYGEDAPGKIIKMDLDITADDFVLLGHPPGKDPIPYVYWNYGVTPREKYDQAERDGTLRDLPFNHNAKFAAEIEPSLQAGIEGMAIASVTFLAS